MQVSNCSVLKIIVASYIYVELVLNGLESFFYRDLLRKVDFETSRKHAQVAANVPKLLFRRCICVDGVVGGLKEQ